MKHDLFLSPSLMVNLQLGNELRMATEAVIHEQNRKVDDDVYIKTTIIESRTRDREGEIERKSMKKRISTDQATDFSFVGSKTHHGQRMKKKSSSS